MIYSILVTSDPVQEQSFSLFGYRLRFTLRYNSVGGVWNYDLYDQNKEAFICQSFGLAVNAPSLMGKNLPFVVVLDDTSGLGLNSVNQTDMGSRLRILFIDKAYYHEAIRQTD